MKLANRFMPVIGGAVAGGVIALILSAGSTTTHSVTTTVAPSRSSVIPTSFSGRGLSVNQISHNASAGVVDITVTSTSNGPGGFFGGGGGAQQTTGEGAGVVYDSKGNILTDEHVVSGANSVQVTLQNGHKYSARVLGTDPSTDVAVIHVDAPSSDLHPLPFADSSAAHVGDNVVAIGSPFGLPGTVTTGIVSAVDRSIQAPNQYTITGAIQTDAAINPGNSGGPLLSASGQVLGLNDQIDTNSQSNAGVGFAVPSNTVARVAQQIIAGHTVKHAYIGVHLAARGTGAAVQSVAAGSPASKAGIQQGDVITSVDGKAVSSTEQFIATIDGHSPGDTVTLAINHGGQTKNVTVTLGTRPS
jgi:putative serine protease PepD